MLNERQDSKAEDYSPISPEDFATDSPARSENQPLMPARQAPYVELKSQGASPGKRDDITFATKLKNNKASVGTASAMANFLNDNNVGSDDKAVDAGQFFNMAHLAAELDPHEKIELKLQRA